MGIITLTSDFGTQDHYVASLKAVILAKNHHSIVDISHHVRQCDISHAAHILGNVFRDFPEGTVHLVTIDSLRETPKPVVILLENHYFVGFDCGIFGLISNEKPKKIIGFDSKITTSLAKECLAPIAERVASGESIENLGTSKDELVRAYITPPKVSKQEIVGRVVHIDHYGNLITNIYKKDFEKMIQLNGENTSFSIQVGREDFSVLHTYYSDVNEPDCFLLFNSNDFLEIGIRMGNASKLLGIRKGGNIFITFQKMNN